MEARSLVDQLYRDESRRVFATLIRLLGDFDLAEDAMHEAFAAALSSWPEQGIPTNPRAWLISTGRFRGIDVMRRRARFDAELSEAVLRVESESENFEEVADDQLRLMFACCHPSLPHEGRVALTLREVCGLTTEEIGSAFLTSPSTIAQRIVRAKAKIRNDHLSYELPGPIELEDRLGAVLQVVYLVFNEGYYASSGADLIRTELTAEAIRLGRLIADLLPVAEAKGLLALMLLHDARKASRTSESGEVVLMEDQDRSKWNASQIEEAVRIVGDALKSTRLGPYTLQAAIAAVHCQAATAHETDWRQIVGLYDLLLSLGPSSVVELNRAVAVAMADGPQAGLSLVDDLLSRGQLTEYSLAHSARGELCRRLGRIEDSRWSFQRALELASQEQERTFLKKRLDTLEKIDGSVSIS